MTEELKKRVCWGCKRPLIFQHYYNENKLSNELWLRKLWQNNDGILLLSLFRKRED